MIHIPSASIPKSPETRGVPGERGVASERGAVNERGVVGERGDPGSFSWLTVGQATSQLQMSFSRANGHDCIIPFTTFSNGMPVNCLAAVTLRSRVLSPPLQVDEHGDHTDHSVILQDAAHGCVLHFLTIVVFDSSSLHVPGVTAGTIVRFHLSNPVPHGCVHSVCRAQAETTQSFPVDSDLRLCNDVGGEIVDNVNGDTGDTGDTDVGGEASVVGGSGVVLRLSYPKVGSGVAGATSTSCSFGGSVGGNVGIPSSHTGAALVPHEPSL